MKAVLIKRSIKPDTSFVIDEHVKPYFDYPMHFHPQYELTYVIRGKGTRFVGNSIHPFEEGDMVLLGSNVPHYWRNNQEYYEKNSRLTAHSIVLQFDYNVLGDAFFEAPENHRIRQLLLRENGGFVVNNSSKPFIAGRLKKLFQAKDTRRIILLLEILHEISGESATTQISFGHTVSSHINHSEMDRLNKVIVYVSENFRDEIALGDVADLVNMNPSSFCKFFRKKYQKPFFDFVNEIRIGHACQKLREDNLNITEICYLSGYNNFSNFSRMFKRITSYTPSAYKKMLRSDIVPRYPPHT